MKALILAAEGSKNANTRHLPTCLQPVSGGSCLLEQQIRKLNLLGVDDSDITVVIGSQGSWSLESALRQIQNFKSINIIVNDLHVDTTSEMSFYKALPSLSAHETGILCINSDTIIDIRHLESLIESPTKSSILVRRPSSVNQPGVYLQLSSTNFISLIPDSQAFEYPWYIYAGVSYLSPSAFKCLAESDPYLGSGGLIYSIDALVSLGTFSWVDYDHLDSYKISNTRSRDLSGGSFAALTRSHLVRKQAVIDGCDKLLDEIQWLEQLPREISPYFPPVVDSLKSDNIVWYDMPWYDLPSLRKNILTGVFNPEKAWEVMQNVLNFMFDQVYINTYNDSAGLDWLVSKHITRVRDRISETWAKSPDMRPLLSRDSIIINGKSYLNIPSCLILLASKVSLLEGLAPETLRMIHGDLHFQNILIGPAGNDRGFILADPRGELNGSDVFYDMGKLWHSFNGLYDLIHTDLFTLQDLSTGDSACFSFNFTSMNMLKTYSQIKSLANFVLGEYSLIQSDSLWVLKTLFSEAMHFSSVMAFHLHITKDNQRAKLLYLQGVKLLNEFISASEAHKYSNDQSIVNRLELNDWRSSFIL